MTENKTQKTLHIKSGTLGVGVREALSQLGKSNPGWSWYEPRPGSLLGTPLHARDLHPTLRPGLTLPPDPVQADEARLFWPDGALHLVADGPHTRWFAWRRGQAPEWVHWDAAVEDTRSLRAVAPYRILLRDSYAAFGLGTKAPHDHIQADLAISEYRDQGALIAWTLGAFQSLNKGEASDD